MDITVRSNLASPSTSRDAAISRRSVRGLLMAALSVIAGPAKRNRREPQLAAVQQDR
jgi:hypothetical protein